MAATVYYDQNGVILQLIRDSDNITPMAGLTGVVLSETSDAGLIADITNNWTHYVVSGGNIQKNGVTVPVVGLSLDEKLAHLQQMTKTLAACVKAIVAANTAQPALFANAPAWAKNQIAAANTWITQQGG